MKLTRVAPRDITTILNILKSRLPGREVWAFGSRVSEQPKEFSDLDLVVISSEPLSAELLMELRHDFDSSDLPFKVDLVDWSGISEAFRDIIKKKYIVLQRTEGN